MKGKTVKERFCVDCRYYAPDTWGCHHEQAVSRMDQVTGKPVYYLAEHMRNIIRGPCGIDGELFEPKPPTLWQRFKAGLRQARKESGE